MAKNRCKATRWIAVLIVLGAAGVQCHDDSSVLARPEVGPVKDGDGDGGVGHVGGDGVRLPEAHFRGPINSDQQSGAEAGGDANAKSSLAKVLNLYSQTSSYPDGKTEEAAVGESWPVLLDPINAGTLEGTDIGDHLRLSHSSKDADSASLLVEDSNPFTLGDGMDRLKAVSHRLRSDKDANSASLWVEVRDVAHALLRGLLFVQEHYEKGDKEGAVGAIKSTVGNLEYFVKASRGMKAKGSNSIDILESSSPDDARPYDLEKISNARLAEFLQPQVFDEQIEMVRDAVNILENFDFSSLSSQIDKDTSHNHFESDLDSTNDEYWQERKDSQETFKFESNAFDSGFAGAQTKFSQSRGQFRPQNFFDHSSLQNFLYQHKTTAGNQLYAQRLSKMSSLVQNDKGVMARHELRMNALGDTCPSECTDNQCNCEKLFRCVNKLSAYDLAAMVAGGFIDRNPSSKNYANFTVSVDDLSLFDADGNIGEKLAQIKADAVDNNDIGKCTAVLEKLYTGCDPSKVSCSNPNTESFQVSVDQVCSAVETKTKLLFEVVGDEFDGFVDKGVGAKPKPLSFDVCREFIATFDSLYEARNQTLFTLPNPMRKSTQALHDKTTAQIFQHTQFPVRNWFNKDHQTGVVDRTFVGVTGVRYFTIVLLSSEKMPLLMTHTVKAISYDASCGRKVSLKTHNPGDALQHFKLSDDGKSLVPKNCVGHRLTMVGISSDVCFEGGRLRLMPVSSTNTAQEFRFRLDGSIVSVKCPNLAMSAIEDGMLLESVDHPYLRSLIAVSFMNPASKKVFSTISVWCADDDPKSLRLKDYDTASQRQYFHVKGSGESLSLYSAAECGESEGVITNGGAIVEDGQRSVEEKCETGNNIKIAHRHSPDIAVTDRPTHQKWIIKGGVIELDSGSGCSSKVIGFLGNGAVDTLLKLQDKETADPNQKFIPVSDEIIFLPAFRKLMKLWDFYSVDPPYDFAVIPGFPGNVNGDLLSSATDKELSKYAMHSCDSSMDLLLGSQMSLGTLRAIVSDLQTNGPERMPGECCFDTPTTNQDRLGLEFDPNVMTCENRGLWHLGISEEACNNAGGKWFRSPCVTLKSCIDARPKRFDLNSPQAGTCQDVLKRLSIGFVSSRSQHADYTFQQNPSGCSNFCRSLPEESHQVGMMTEGDECICMYNSGKVPDQVPDYATRSPPKFSLVSNGKALGLSHETTDCTADEISIELQDFVVNSPRQQLYLSYEGQLVSAKCPQRVFTAFSNGNLQAMAPYYHLDHVDKQQQQWVYSASSRSISNLKYTHLLISSINSDVSTLDSDFFSLENQGTGFMLGVDEGGDICADGQRIVLQTETAGSLNQKFKLGDNGEIISMKCPSYAIAIPHCTMGTPLQLQTLESLSAANNHWQFSADGKINSLDCPEWFIGTGAESRAGFNAVTPAPRVRAGRGIHPADNFGNDTATDTTAYHDETYPERQRPSVGTEIVLSSSEMQHQSLVWTQRHRHFTDLIGPYFFVNSGNEFAMGVEEGECTGEMNLNVQEYNQNMPSQQFYLGNHGAIYSAKCSGGAISMEGSCGEGKLLKLRSYEDDESMLWEYNSNGLLRSAKCLDQDYVVGVAATLACGGSNGHCSGNNSQEVDVAEIHKLRCCADTNLGADWKWHYDCPHNVWGASELDGNCYDVDFYEGKRICEDSGGRLCTVEEVLDDCTFGSGCMYNHEMVWTSNVSSQPLTLPSTGHQSSTTWNRENTRLLSELSSRLWNQEWTIDFVANDYDGNNLVDKLLGPKESNSAQDANCHGPNAAFSSTFEEFAKESLINNANEKAQCQHAREQLAFEADYPFDADVCDAFNEKMCSLDFAGGLLFTGVDHAMELLSNPPQFKQVEYQKVEYEKAEYKKGAFAPPEYAEDPELLLEPIDEKTKEWDPAEDEESSVGPNPSQGGLGKVQDYWLAAQLVQHAAERAEMIAALDKCQVLPDNIPAPMTCLPNLVKYTCNAMGLIAHSIIIMVLVIAEMAAEILFFKFEKATEGPDGEVYANNASRKTYWNLKNLDGYLKNALQKTNDNMKKQHESMRKHLQDRHRALEANIRRDIIDSQNDLGNGIVTVQNAIGQAIVDARNANGEAIVDARNANSDQHNAISNWLHENLCAIYEAQGGDCAAFIGPLPEDQSFTPMVLSWPGGLPSMMDRLERVEVMGTDIHEAMAGIEKTLTIGTSFTDKGEPTHGFEAGILKQKLDEFYGMMKANEDSVAVRADTVEGKVDAVDSKVDAVDSKVDAVDGKVDAMDGKVDAVEAKLDVMQGQMDEMTELISRVMQQNTKLMEQNMKLMEALA